MMSRKHYRDMADRFGRILATPRIRTGSAGARAVWECVNEYCEHAESDNPAFDAARFRDHVRNVRDVAVAEADYVAAVNS